MKKLISTLPEYAFIMHQQIGPDEHAVLLGREKTYAAVTMQPKRLVAMSPNYQADGHGLLSGPLTKDGLEDLLQWTDRETAVVRFYTLAGLPGQSLTLLPDKRPLG